MLQVKICINDRVVLERRAVRQSYRYAPPKSDDIVTYRTDDGRSVEHRYGDGAEELARKLMNWEAVDE